MENLIDDARRENAFGLLMSLNMLIEFGDAFDFSGAISGNGLRKPALARYEVLHLTGPCSAAIAYKYRYVNGAVWECAATLRIVSQLA